MMKSRHSLLNRLMSRFSYSEKFIFISLLFALSTLILSILVVQEKAHDINIIDSELIGTKYLRPLRRLVEHIPKHKILMNRYLTGNATVKSEIITIESQINDDLKKLTEVDKELGEQIHLDTAKFEENSQGYAPQEINSAWQNIQNQSADLTLESSNKLHDSLIMNIRNLMEKIGDASNLILDPTLASHYLMTNILVRLPASQDLLSQTIGLGEEIFVKKTFNVKEQSQLISLISLLQADVNVIKKNYETAFNDNKDITEVDLRGTIAPELAIFTESTEDFIKLIDEKILNATKNITLTPQEFDNAGEAAYDSSFKLWDVSIDQLDQLFILAKRNLELEQVAGLGLAFFFAIAGFLLGLFIMRQISVPLNNLTGATRRLAGGDLSTRVPIFYQDEIGRVGIAFNNMAQSFQSIIGQLRELLESIKRLANGDFSARVTVTNPNDEIGQVGYSFNNMAQSFEDIISQLHQLGINLTTSATEIAASSKQQEAIIMEQEATTREISVTANEISTTAKEFAGTVSEVSKVAEHTSELASGGKESLTHMETIMRQMVEASTSIASKLAVLNEKAGNITGVITTITKVADQTNLLSLNASIEAEKAGEYGRSFAVIAREIRRLADQTAYATLDIEKIVNEIMSAVSTSVMGVDDFTQEIRQGVNQVGTVGEQLSMIIEQVQALTIRFESVNQGMQGQSAGAEQINDAISQLSQTAQQTTESIHQFRNTIQQLNAAATDLRVAVSRIKRS